MPDNWKVNGLVRCTRISEAAVLPCDFAWQRFHWGAPQRSQLPTVRLECVEGIEWIEAHFVLRAWGEQVGGGADGHGL